MNKKSFFGSILFISMVSLVSIGGVSETQAQTGSFTIIQQVRNLTKQNFTWANSASATGSDRIEFRLEVTWQGSALAENVLVRQTLADKLSYAGNLKLDGSPVAGNVVAENLNIGTMGPAQSKVVTFEALVAPVETLEAGVSDLVSTATVFNTQGAASARALVRATGSGTPTDVPTGPLSLQMASLAAALLIAGMFGSVVFVGLYLKREVFESAYETRTERRLDTLIAHIRKNEL